MPDMLFILTLNVGVLRSHDKGVWGRGSVEDEVIEETAWR